MLSYPFAAFGKPLSQVLRETPHPVGSEVLVRVGSCGLCHSDVHLHEGYFDLGNGNKLDLSRGIAPPRVLGHEIAGIVAAVGPDASGVAVGDRRVVFPWIGCSACGLCKDGHEELCMAPRALGVNRDGGFADQVLVSHPRYLFAYDPLPESQACTYACSGLTAYSALKKCAPLGEGDMLLVIGAGDCLDPTDADATKAFMKASGGAAAAIDFVGAAATFSFGLSALRKGGKLVCVGLFGGAAPVMPAMLPLRAVTITGSYVGSLAEMRETMALARQGSLPALPVTTRPLAEVNEALAALRSGTIRGRAVLQP